MVFGSSLHPDDEDLLTKPSVAKDAGFYSLATPGTDPMQQQGGPFGDHNNPNDPNNPNNPQQLSQGLSQELGIDGQPIDKSSLISKINNQALSLSQQAAVLPEKRQEIEQAISKVSSGVNDSISQADLQAISQHLDHIETRIIAQDDPERQGGSKRQEASQDFGRALAALVVSPGLARSALALSGVMNGLGAEGELSKHNLEGDGAHLSYAMLSELRPNPNLPQPAPSRNIGASMAMG